MTARKPKSEHKPRGRPHGSKNKATQAFAAKLEKSGMTPLAFLLKHMRRSDNPLELRLDCAKAAARYCHPTLQSVLTTAGSETISHAEWVKKMANQDDDQPEGTIH